MVCKIIWSCWFQGRDRAPPLVRRCLESWERHNPDWEFRCLDSRTIGRYVELGDHVDLQRQTITAASLSDILRILLLHEFGGVWVDATVLCNHPLDDWLPGVMGQGFFAFEKPVPDRPLASWFLAAEPGNPIIGHWCAAVMRYWAGRVQSDDYFWFHHLFAELCETDETVRRLWEACPRQSAGPPHDIQRKGFYQLAVETVDDVDWTVPVFKLTYRIEPEKFRPGCLLHHVLGCDPTAPVPEPEPKTPATAPPMPLASLKVSTENLGDHIQIIAGQRLLARLGAYPSVYLDRDNEIASGPSLENLPGPVGILLNGWFKTNRTEWPPYPKLDPVFLGFHIRLFQCPELISEAALAYYRKHQPIGCRDAYTCALLKEHGVDAFVSQCLSLVFPRRVPNPERHTETFVVSRDQRLLGLLPSSLGPVTPICHYSGSTDFAANMVRARRLLENYRDRANLIVTSLLHCALPAIAMGIPVVAVFPINTAPGHASDLERFSSLAEIIPVYHPNDIDRIDWAGHTADVSGLKLDLVESFFRMSARWRKPGAPAVGPIAPSSALPVPTWPPRRTGKS